MVEKTDKLENGYRGVRGWRFNVSDVLVPMGVSGHWSEEYHFSGKKSKLLVTWYDPISCLQTSRGSAFFHAGFKPLMARDHRTVV